MCRKIILSLIAINLFWIGEAQISQPIKQFIRLPEMRGSSFSIVVREVNSGETIYNYDGEREMIPASVMKIVTTAAALELLGEENRYVTSLEYDGEIKDGILNGNLYIKGSGDPTLGSSHFADDNDKWKEQNRFIDEWISVLNEKGIKKINGSVISDESIFDTEGISPKWLGEDLGNWYGAGSYGISVFDNIYRLYLKTKNTPGNTAVITGIEPSISSLNFHNYLSVGKVVNDSCYIMGFPFSNDRYLYGVVPEGKNRITIRGDIPDPALFLANYVTEAIENAGIKVEKAPDCYRQLKKEGQWQNTKRTILTEIQSPTVTEIVRIVNEKSHNLYADALLKTMGLQYRGKENCLSSFGKGSEVIKKHWQQKGLNVSSLWMADGSGLAVTDKLSADLVCELLIYMYKNSSNSEAFVASLPLAGREGSIRNFLKGTSLEGNARIKSGSMSRVKGYAGYITYEGKEYAVAVFVNNYSGEGRKIVGEIEKLLVSLF